MPKIIRRELRRGRGRRVFLAGAGCVAIAGAVMLLAWQKGAPVPVHDIVVDLPVPVAQVQK